MNAEQIKEQILQDIECSYVDKQDRRKYYAGIVSLIDEFREEIVKKSLSVAVSALYFDDSSDYGGALWDIVQSLGGNEAVNLLTGNEDKAHNKYCMVDK